MAPGRPMMSHPDMSEAPALSAATQGGSPRPASMYPSWSLVLRNAM
jgi:hypothetical protein